MIIKIQNEQPFQVLATQFSIGPSSSGYDLMFSADGVNYSKLFTVGANVNRQVTQVAAGSYYYLSGNTDNVTVNWYGNCVVPGEGGGGGTQYTAGDGIQINGTSIAVKAGEGLGFSGDTLVVSGISAGGDYVIVDSLGDIQDPEDGMMAMPRTETGTTEVHRLYVSDPSDYTNPGFWGKIVDEDQNNREIYFTDGQFYWDWGNKEEQDSTWHNGEWNGRKYTFRCTLDPNDDANCTFDIIFPEGSDLTLEPHQSATGIATGASTETTYTYSTPNIYINGEWVPTPYVIKWDDIQSIESTAQTEELYDKIAGMVERGFYPVIYDKSRGATATYANEDKGRNIIRFTCDNANYTYDYRISKSVFSDDGFNEYGIRFDGSSHYQGAPYVILGGVDSGGTNGSDLDQLRYNEQESVYRYAFRYPNPDNPDEYFSLGLVSWWNRYRVEWDNDEGWTWYYVVAADVPIDTTIYHGVWGWIDNEHIETLQWTSGSTYESQTYTKYVPQP